MSTDLTHFDPIEASSQLKSGFIDYITTTFHIADPVYKAALRTELGKEGFLSKGPYLDMNGSYKTGRSLRELISSGQASVGFETLEPVAEKEKELKIERPLYLHQERALLKADAGQNLIVTTGTGSGKTECFLLPILQTLLQEEQNDTLGSGVRAILIYPMNALANDQMKRMRAIMKGHDRITFGIYTGNTEHTEQKARAKFHENYGRDAVILENELLSRERMQETPPNILITNYSMLEYMMLRPKDDAVFSGAKLRYIVLDEAHVYKGTTGMETAMLMRRLRARISTRDTVQFILTSATLGGRDADREITQFGEQLCGVHFDPNNIVRSEDATPGMNALNTYPSALFHKLADTSIPVIQALNEFQISDPAPTGDDNEKLYELMLTSRLFADLRHESKQTMEIGALSRAMGITRQELLDLVAVCTRAEKGKTALLKARIHYFVRALEGAYVTLGQNKQLMLTRQERTKDGYAVFEVAICQDCGRLALVGKADEYLTQVSRKTDRDPNECDYFLIWEDEGERIVFGDEADDEEEIMPTDEADYAVCACCGKIDGYANLRFGNICDCEHPEYIHIKQVNRTKAGNTAKCPACGHGEFRAFYLGNEAATSVLGTELFEQLPTKTVTARPVEESGQRPARFAFGRPRPAVVEAEKSPQFLCFSDSRSEAAHFAVYMENAYKRFLRNRGVWKVINQLTEDGVYQLSVSAFVDKLTHLFDAERTFDHWDVDRDRLDTDKLHGESVKNAWIAVTSELFASRHITSLSSLGLLHFRYEKAEYMECRDSILGVLMETGLSENDADALMQRIFLDGVYTGSLNAGRQYNFTDEERESIFFSKGERHMVKVKGPNSNRYVYGWSARKRENGNYYPNTRLRRVVSGTGWDEVTANDFLQELWEVVLAPADNQFAFNICDFKICINARPGQKTWRCRKCGNITAHNVQNRCAVLQCGGSLEEVSPEALQQGNHYVNRCQGQKMKPLQMREHTAQLSRNCQTKYQQAFVEGKLNALSCSTTFEMGVDVGGLEMVYMRDIPPGPANYVQRAGRAGRAAHTAAYVLTYAKLSSHDFTFYNSPERVISGKIKAPVFALENEKVLYRHIFAVALAEFFACNEDVYGGDDRYYLLNAGGYERLKEFLESPSERLRILLKQSVPKDMHERLGILDDSWREHLIGENGVLEVAVENYRAELAHLESELAQAARQGNHDEAARLSREIAKLRAAPADGVQNGDNKNKKHLIEFLARNNVLPKYGFPVDTVELQIGAQPTDASSGLQLSRDLQMAIAEYAPGAQVIADGKMYTSRYVRKASGRGKKDTGWEYGYFAVCPICKENNFTKNSSARTSGSKCISCGHNITRGHWKQTVEPRLGFIVEDVNGQAVPMHRPERDYKTDDYYVGDGTRTVLQTRDFQIGDEIVRLQSTKNDSLAVVGLGEHVICPVCGYATNDGETVLKERHKTPRGYECSYRADGRGLTPVRLSHVFKTDAAAITFMSAEAADYDRMISVLYAVLEGLSKELDIERTDIKGCLHKAKPEGYSQSVYSVILYDAVAGGAGHVRRIVTEDGEVFQRVLKRAHQIVSTCKCEPSCYSCIRNYYNQKIHDKLDRNKAAAFLAARLGKCIPIEIAYSHESTEAGVVIVGSDLAEDNASWSEVFEAYGFDGNGAEMDAHGVPKTGCFIMPEVTVQAEALEPNFVWEHNKVMVFNDINSALEQTLCDLGWRVVLMSAPVEELMAVLRGDV